MLFGNFVVVKHNGKIVCGKVGDRGIYRKQMGDANPVPFSEVEPLFEIEVHRPFPEHFKVDDFRKFVIRTLTDADPLRGPHPAITHCDNCGCDWLDNGLNPVGCPYCKLSAETEALREALAAMVSWIPSADTYRRLGFDPEVPMRAHDAAKALLAKGERK